MAQFLETYKRATVYVVFVMTSLLASAVLFALLHSTGTLAVGRVGIVDGGQFGGAFAGFLVILLVLLRTYERSSADQTTMLKGNVFDEAGAPVEGARVFVEGLDRQRQTDMMGWFSIEVPKHGPWNVLAAHGSRVTNNLVLRDHHDHPVRLVLSGNAVVPPPDAVCFASVAVDMGNPNWFEISGDDITLSPHPVLDPSNAKLHFSRARVELADPSFDVTIMNRSGRPVIVTAVGIELMTVAEEAYRDMTGGYLPSAAPIRITDSYDIAVPELWPSEVRLGDNDPFAPDLDAPVSVNRVISKTIPPVYLEPQAPFRYTLRLVGYDTRIPNKSLLRMWARTDESELLSEVIYLDG